MREVPSVNALRQHWIVPEARQLLLEHLPDGERGAKMLRQVMGLTEYDLYDVLADISFGIDPKTRIERVSALEYKQAAWLGSLPTDAAQTLRALANQFGRDGIEALESRRVFDAPDVVKAGGLTALRKIGAADVLRETKERLLAP
jgi:type I restriction enzyme R subunit